MYFGVFIHHFDVDAQKENEQLMKSIDPNAVVSMSVEKTEGLEAVSQNKSLEQSSKTELRAYLSCNRIAPSDMGIVFL